MISRNEILMSRDSEYPLSPELEVNLGKLLIALNKFRLIYNKSMKVTSGYRPGHYNRDAHGASNSAHLSCEACDFADSDGSLDDFCTKNIKILEQCGIYIEHPDSTPGWSHITTRSPPSGKRIFRP